MLYSHLVDMDTLSNLGFI